MKNRNALIEQANKQEKIMRQNKGLSNIEIIYFNKAKIIFFETINQLNITWAEWVKLSTNDNTK